MLNKIKLLLLDICTRSISIMNSFAKGVAQDLMNENARLKEENNHLKQKSAYKKQIMNSQVNKEIEREKIFKKAPNTAS